MHKSEPAAWCWGERNAADSYQAKMSAGAVGTDSLDCNLRKEGTEFTKLTCKAFPLEQIPWNREEGSI